MAALGHFRQIAPLPKLSACPLRSDRVRTFAPQRIDAVCHKATYAAQQGPSLFDHLVGEREQLCRKFEPERLCGLEIEHKPQLRGSLYR
jgi:hypothetical protein